MTIGSVRHDLALQSAKQKILRSKLSLYAKELYLYGSAARGEVRWDSDIDLLLVLDPSQKNSRELKREITNIVATLKEREQTVIKMRFGLENFTKTTLEDIGKLFGVTKECIRQTEIRALNKMRLKLQEG